MMIRQTDSYLADIIMNHPDVRPTIHDGDWRGTVERHVADPANAIYANATGCVAFIYSGNGVYSGHVAFLPEGRGCKAIKDCTDALEQLFWDHGARRVIAEIPLELRAARFLVRRLGFVSRGRDRSKSVEHFKLEAKQWVKS